MIYLMDGLTLCKLGKLTTIKRPKRITNYRVVYTLTPYPRWDVRYQGKRMGYRAWNQRIAINAAKELARNNRPASVIIQDKQGKLRQKLTYPVRRK
jgi:hypothetical protein